MKRKRRTSNSRKKLKELEEFAIREFYRIVKKIKKNEKNLRYIG